MFFGAKPNQQSLGEKAELAADSGALSHILLAREVTSAG
jgi:hypothetical protein